MPGTGVNLCLLALAISVLLVLSSSSCLQETRSEAVCTASDMGGAHSCQAADAHPVIHIAPHQSRPPTEHGSLEKAYIMIKPDGVQRGLIGDIIARFEQKGFTLRAMRLLNADRSLVEQHYAEHTGKPFFHKIVDYICSGPVVAMVWEGKGVVAAGRAMIGATNPLNAAPGTIRGDYGIESGRNVIHGSDSVESANREIALWFPQGLTEWEPVIKPWVYE